MSETSMYLTTKSINFFTLLVISGLGVHIRKFNLISNILRNINKCQIKTCQNWKSESSIFFFIEFSFFWEPAPFLDFRLVSLEQDCHNLSHPVWALKREAADSALASTCQLFCKTYDFLYVTSFTETLWTSSVVPSFRYFYSWIPDTKEKSTFNVGFPLHNQWVKINQFWTVNIGICIST